MNKLIGISGKIKSGKDTLLDAAKELFGDRAVRVGFSDKLKEIASDVSGDPIELFQTQEGKTGLMDSKWVNSSGSIMTRREFLQKLGTEVRVGVCPNFWVNAYLTKIKYIWDSNPDTIIFTPDCRFFNEVNCVIENGGRVIRINRKFTWIEFCKEYGIERLDEYIGSKDKRLVQDWIPILVGLNTHMRGSRKDVFEALRAVSHISETEVDNFNFNETIENDGSLDLFEDRINSLLIRM